MDVDDPFEGLETVVPRGGPIAGGKRLPIPAASPLPEWSDPTPQDLGDGIDDPSLLQYDDLESINRDLLRLRIRMNRVRREMRAAGRAAAEAKLRYLRALRRALVQQTGGSAETRKAAAELACEELEAEMLIRATVADEYATLFRAVRDDVENAKVAAYNVRSLMSLN